MFYLGTYVSPESKRAYDNVKSEWLANRHNPKFAAGPVRKQTTISDLANAYVDFAFNYYGIANEYQNLERAVRPISELYELTPSADFGAIEFKACREWWLEVFIRGGDSYRRIEPDFFIVRDGFSMGVEVDGDTVHTETPEEAHARTLTSSICFRSDSTRAPVIAGR